MTLYAVWEKDSSGPEATDCITVNQVFSGLTIDEFPWDFSIEYTAVNTKDPEYSTTKTLTMDNAEDFDETTMTVTWLAPHYSKTGGSTVTIKENCDVDKYTYTTATTKGTVDDSTHTVSMSFVSVSTKGTVTLTNTYTPASVTPENPKLTGITKTRLTSVPAELGLTGINTDNPVSLQVGESATLLYAITVTGDEGANYTITDPTAEAVDPNAMSGTIDSTGEATVYVTMTIDIDDVVEGYVENTAYVEAGVNTDLGDITPTVSEATNVIGELTGGKRYDDAEDGTIDFTVEVTNKIGATLSSLKLTDTMQKISMIMGEDENPSYTIKLYSQSGEEITPVVSSVTSDGRETVWYIEGPIPQDAKVVLTYSGKIDSTVVEGEKWKNSVFPEYTTEEGAMVYGDFEFVGTAEGNWVPSGMFSCEGVVGE